MNFWRKILLVAIIFVFAWNAKGMQHQALPLAAPVVGANILDFDTIANVGDNIPAMFQPKIYEPAGYNAAGPNNLRYVYFTVFNPGEVEDGNFIHAVRRNPNQADKNIFFPMDGHQPTTPEAVSWSCANIDNRENSPITGWYMQMFGVIPFNANNYIKAGWSTPALGNGAINAQRIMYFSQFMDVQINDPSNTRIQILLKTLFLREFRKIASTSVGRVLLYRILIEVRRHISGSNVGMWGNDITLAVTPRDRNKNRSVEIDKGPLRYIKGTGRIKFDIMDIRNTVIGKRKDLYSYIATDPTLNDVNIFHEMIHWFHYLRNPNRQNLEVSFQFDNLGGNDVADDVYQCYWGMLVGTQQERLNSMTPWRADDDCRHVLLEEIRTMLGMPKNASYIEGDDLSENLYRSCTRQPLCFGHESSPFYEDNSVINKVLQVTNSGVVGYLLDFENPNYRNTKIFDKGYTPYYPKKGLGNSYFK